MMFFFFEMDFMLLSFLMMNFLLYFFMKSFLSDAMGLARFGFMGSVVMVLFVFLFFSNYLGMVPYSYPLTAQLSVCMLLSVSMFLGVSLSKVIYNKKSFLVHLCPEGVPMILAPFLILVETVSFLVRPVALMLRLFANITAGHVLLGMVVGMLPVILSFIALPLIVLELMVCLIQSYIFTLLILLWFNE